MCSLYPKCKGKFKYSLRVSSLSVYTQRREEREKKNICPARLQHFTPPFPGKARLLSCWIPPTTPKSWL